MRFLVDRCAGRRLADWLRAERGDALFGFPKLHAGGPFHRALVGLIQAAAQKLAMVVGAPASQLARVIDARRAAMEDSGGEA